MMTDKDLIRELEISKLQEENEELKSQLRCTTHCFDEEEHNRLEEENKELKKQVDEYKKDIKDLDNQNKNAFKNMQLNQSKVCNMAKQQKEFIDWLECEVNDYKCKNPLIVENLHTQYDIREIETDMLMKVLNKYKEIVNGSKRN